MDTTAKRLPFTVKQALIDVCGKCFWLKQPLFDLLIAAGVDEELIERVKDEPKFKIARHVIHELEQQGAVGYSTLQQIVTELYHLKRLPDDNVDKKTAVNVLNHLKDVVREHQLVVQKEAEEQVRKHQEREARIQRITQRQQRLAEIRDRFNSLFQSDDPQSRGYSLEDILKELFELNEISYRKSYRTGSEQIDGHFRFEGFDYLVEAR